MRYKYMSDYKRIFIVGHSGAGKGVLGKAVAEKLGWKFVDADFGLELHIGRNLSEIIGKEGVEAFHHCESNILNSLLAQENIVVSTDSIIVCNEKNREILSSEFTVYLDVSTPVQIERISRNPEPLLPTDIKKLFDKLHDERDTFFESVASLSIKGDDNNLEKHVDDIVKKYLQIGNNDPLPEKLKLEKKDFIFFHKISHTPVHLSEQQAICLKLLAQGKTSKEIARDLNISFRTVEGYIAKTMEILGCGSSKELIGLFHEK